ncbi:alpha-amylase family glycosyl hydrolase [Shigella flexneri]
MGEHLAISRQWLQADVEDAAMNYRGFTFPLWGFIAKHRYLLRIRSKLTPKPVSPGFLIMPQGFLMNNFFVCLMSWTATILRDLKRCSVGYSWPALAVVWLFAAPGVPCIYYGDEVGLDGKNNPFAVSRSPGRWKSGFGVIRTVPRSKTFALRKKSQALRRGGCQVLLRKITWWYLSAC